MPWPNRTYEEWKGEVQQDMGLITMHLKELDREGATREEKITALACARKEARRLTRDIERIGSECLDISKEEIDEVRL
jgi:hypothetical protein